MGKSQARNPTHKQKAERIRAYEHLLGAAEMKSRILQNTVEFYKKGEGLNLLDTGSLRHTLQTWKPEKAMWKLSGGLRRHYRQRLARYPLDHGQRWHLQWMGVTIFSK